MQNTHSLYFRLLVLIIGGLTQCLAMKHLTVMRGDTLTLTCRLKKHHMSSPVEWKNQENLSLFFNNIKALKDKRTSLVALTDSKFSIRVTNIKFKDGGMYNCVRYYPQFSEKKFKVTVIDAPKLEKDEQDDKTIVTCSASANEHPPSLSWLIDNGVVIEALPNYEVDNVTKKYTAVSHLNVKSTMKRVRVTCLAHHPALYHSYLENSIYLGSQSEDTSSSSSSSSSSSKNPKYPSTTLGKTDSTVITTLPSSTSEDTSTSSKYPSPTLGTTDTKVISNLFSSTSFTSSHSQSESTDYSNTTVAVAETTEDISSNGSANVLSNTTANESISETTEGTQSNTSITSSSNNTGNNSSHEKQIIKKGNSALLVLLVTCLIICLFVVLVFFLVRLRKAHIVWKKENEESEQSVESNKSKSSSEEKQKQQQQQQRRQGFWNTSFTKYKAEETLENGAQATSASVQVVNENPQDFISRSGIKETEL